MKILLVDDHKMMRDGLRAVLEREEGMEVVGEAADGTAAIALARQVRPEVVVLDISMPNLNGIDATSRLVAEHPGIKVIGLSMNSDRRYVVAMFKAGAVGYLLKNSASTELVQAVRAVMDDLTYVSPSIASVLIDSVLAPSTDTKSDRPLSIREREVLQLLAEGKSSKEIASQLAVAVATIETHRRQIMDKLHLRTIAELTKYAIREGLTTVD